MFKKFFNKPLFVSPVSGILKQIEDVDDEMFAGKVLGDGFAIYPTSHTIKSPITGEVTFVYNTKHAIGLRATDGLEVLIHVGVDTVKLNGRGFTAYVKQHQKVRQGETLLIVDFETIKPEVPSIDVIVVFSNGEKCTVHKPGETVAVLDQNIIDIN